MSKKTNKIASQRTPSQRQASAQAKQRNPVLLWLCAALAAIVLIAAAGCSLTRQEASGDSAPIAQLPKEISVQDAAALRTSGAFILDVRQPEEWQEYHIPESTLIPLGDLPNRLSEVPKDQEIVVVCRSGNRSQQGRDILLNAGFDQVTSMTGGLKEWQSSGFETVSGP